MEFGFKYTAESGIQTQKWKAVENTLKYIAIITNKTSGQSNLT